MVQPMLQAALDAPHGVAGGPTRKAGTASASASSETPMAFLVSRKQAAMMRNTIVGAIQWLEKRGDLLEPARWRPRAAPCDHYWWLWLPAVIQSAISCRIRLYGRPRWYTSLTVSMLSSMPFTSSATR